MLNLRIAMRTLIFFFSLVATLMYPWLIVNAQEATITPQIQVMILSPSPGQALQGTILILGDINVEDPILVELSFTYSDDQRETWFLIHEIEDSVPGEINFEWDTTTITDGQYTLRLLVRTDQDQIIALVPGLRVRNYSAIETNTPDPTSTPAPADTHAPTATATTTLTPVPFTPTPLPPNPAQIDTRDIGMSIGKGGIVVISLFAILGIYQYIRNRSRRDE
jgi:hypothetical protein